MWEWLEALENQEGPFSGMVLCYNGQPCLSLRWVEIPGNWNGKSQGSVPLVLVPEE